jgi:glycosyltransferase involved in cell wall biosynthesis
VRLGLVGPLPPPHGGMANQTKQLAALLGAQGVDVRLVRTNEPYRPAWIGRVKGVRASFRLAWYLRDLAAVSREVDVLHVMANSGLSWHLSAAPAILAGAMRDVPVIVNYRGGLAGEFLSRRAAVVRATMRLARAVVVPSPFLQGIFAEHDVHAEIIPNIVDLETFHPAAMKPDDGVHIVVARNLERIYGIDVAIRAAARLGSEFSQLKLSIAGSGPERAALERLTKELGMGSIIRFTGALDVAAVAALYRSAHVVLNPSRADNAPNSLLEAAASGVPIVSTDVGGIAYLVEHQRSAWLVPSETPEAMADAIRLVLRDSALRDRLRTNGLSLARSCSWTAVRPQWLGLYQRVAEHGALRRKASIRTDE